MGAHRLGPGAVLEALLPLVPPLLPAPLEREPLRPLQPQPRSEQDAVGFETN